MENQQIKYVAMVFIGMYWEELPERFDDPDEAFDAADRVYPDRKIRVDELKVYGN